MFGKVRYQPHKTWVTSWVTRDASIELPRKIQFSVRTLWKKLALGQTRLLFSDLNSISRPEFELHATPTRMCSAREEILRWSSPGQMRTTAAPRRSSVSCRSRSTEEGSAWQFLAIS